MFAFFVVIHLLVCFALVLVVLLQSGKGGGLAGVLGGGGSGGQTLFGGRGAADFLSKSTSVLAFLFMLTSVVLALSSGRGESQSVVRERLQSEGDFLPPAAATPEERRLLEGVVRSGEPTGDAGEAEGAEGAGGE